MLSIAAAHAIAGDHSAVAYAAHKDDAAGNAYPDCSMLFGQRMDEALRVMGVSLYAPFLDMTKAQIVKKGNDLEVVFNRTWSCYKGNEKPCGTCGTCIDRKDAFELAGVRDV
jgi:7-cyano-7-deazaguanine synthase